MSLEQNIEGKGSKSGTEITGEITITTGVVKVTIPAEEALEAALELGRREARQEVINTFLLENATRRMEDGVLGI